MIESYTGSDRNIDYARSEHAFALDSFHVCCWQPRPQETKFFIPNSLWFRTQRRVARQRLFFVFRVLRLPLLAWKCMASRNPIICLIECASTRAVTATRNKSLTNNWTLQLFPKKMQINERRIVSWLLLRNEVRVRRPRKGWFRLFNVSAACPAFALQNYFRHLV